MLVLRQPSALRVRQPTLGEVAEKKRGQVEVARILQTPPYGGEW
jgi:hypothetical protein